MKIRKKLGRRGIILYITIYGMIYISLLLICSAWIKDAYIRENSQEYAPEKFTVEEITRNIEQAEAVEPEADVAVPGLRTILDNIGNIGQENVIGGIYSKEAGLKLPVFNGVTKANLLAGAGTMKAGQQMGAGNYCLAGHHMKNPDLLFGPLTKVNVGNYIYLTDRSSVYTYEVIEKTVVHESQTGILEDEDKPLLTLVTCNVTGVNTNYRLIIRGELLDVSKIEPDGEKMNQAGQDYIEKYNKILQTEEKWSATHLHWLLGIAGAAFVILWISKKIMDKS